jgi:hypothetical protein
MGLLKVPKSATRKTRKYLSAIAFKLESESPYRPRLAREAGASSKLSLIKFLSNGSRAIPATSRRGSFAFCPPLFTLLAKYG